MKLNLFIKIWHHTKKPRFILAFALNAKNPYLKLHYSLLYLSCKKPSALVLNLIAYLRWITYYSWYLSYKASKSQTTQQLQQHGLTRHALFWQLVKFGIVHIISPKQYFDYQLYKNNYLHFVYDHQLPYFHNFTNRQNYQHYVRLMADKYQFARELEKINIPSIKSILYTKSELSYDISPLLCKDTIFCKPNTASRSRDAFLIEYHNANYHLEPINGPVIDSLAEINSYLSKVISRNSSILVQPFLTDHPAIKVLNPTNGATTVRIITARMDEETQMIYLQLEIPLPNKHNNQHQFYTILPLDVYNLEVDSIFKHKFPEQITDSYIITDELKKLLHTAITYCIHAHHKLLMVKSVAFDVIISNDGPVIIEANYNWSVEMLYRVIDATNHHEHPAKSFIQQILC